MYIRKLIHHRNHFRKQNRSDPRIITLNNHINKHEQQLDKIDHKHNLYSLWDTMAKLSNKKPPTQQNRSICFGTNDIDKAKALNKQFTNVTPYTISKTNRHINHTIKTLPTKEIRLTTTQGH